MEPKDADHMHYYFFSKGRYKRKLVSEQAWATALLTGWKPITNTKYQTSIFTADLFRRITEKYGMNSKWYREAIKSNLVFPYMIIGKRNHAPKAKAFKGNRCERCANAPTNE